jgi:hypothetical protein
LAGADESGQYALIAPPGIISLAARASPEAPLGPPHVDLFSAGMHRIPDLVAGTLAAKVTLRVTDPDGAPVPDAVAVLPRALTSVRLISVDPSEAQGGTIRGGSSGVVVVRGVDVGAAAFRAAVGAPGRVPALVDISPAVTDVAIDVVLQPKPWGEVILLTPDGSAAGQLHVNWSVDGGPKRETQRSGEGAIEEDEAMITLKEILPEVEQTTQEAAGMFHLRAASPGVYRVSAWLAGGLRLSCECVVDSRGSRSALALPAGRAVTMRLAAAPPDSGSVPWRLRVRAQGPAEHMGHGRASRPFEINPWAPSPEAPTLRFWCPLAVTEIQVLGASRVDLPVEPMTFQVPLHGEPEISVACSTSGCGWLRCRYESPAGKPRAGVNIEILPLGLQRDRPNGRREARTDASGVAEIGVPPGEYYVSRAREYGPPAWSRHAVMADTVTDAIIVE